MQQKEKKQHKPFYQLANEKTSLANKSPFVRFATKATLVCTPFAYLKLIALYGSLMDIFIPPQNTQYATWRTALHWALSGGVFIFLFGPNEVVTSYKFTPAMLEGIKKDVTAIAYSLKNYCCRRSVYQEIDAQPIKWSQVAKKSIDYSCLTGLSVIHTLFGYVTVLGLFGNSPVTRYLAVGAGLAYTSTLLPLRYVSGISASTDEPTGDDSDDEDASLPTSPPCFSCRKLGIGAVLLMANTGVMVYEGFGVVAFLKTGEITHNIVELFKISLKHLDLTVPLVIASVIAGFIETVAEFTHVDATITTARSRCGTRLNKTYAFLTGLCSDHLEPPILFFALGAMISPAMAWLGFSFGLVVASLDAYWAMEMCAYGIALFHSLFQYVGDLSSYQPESKDYLLEEETDSDIQITSFFKSTSAFEDEEVKLLLPKKQRHGCCAGVFCCAKKEEPIQDSSFSF